MKKANTDKESDIVGTIFSRDRNQSRNCQKLLQETRTAPFSENCSETQGRFITHAAEPSETKTATDEPSH